ncbi:MAG: exonuclease domain-containing protein [Woeseiaceae bacterium]|nr:exonuclease domain-containing protein [Woeseiaceae bacterium]
MDFDQTHWIPVRQQPKLPTFYYHEHFLEMLAFVEQHYAHVLLPEHVAFIGDFRELPVDAQRLYARLVNRKGRIFAVRKLRYPELGDCEPLVRELISRQWLDTPRVEHLEDLFSLMTRSEIYRVLMPVFAGMSRSLKKAELVHFAREHCPPAEFLQRVDAGRYCIQRRSGAVRFLSFLYFGRVQDSLSRFTMRDLGLVRTQDLHETYEARYQERDEAAEHFHYAARVDELASASDDRLRDLARDDWPEPQFAGSAALRDKLAYRLGRSLEVLGDHETALTTYRRGECARCSERTARLLLKTGRRDEAQAHLEQCLDNPKSEEEWFFARDLYEQKFRQKRTSSGTDTLRAAETIDIDESQSGNAERAALEHFEARGQRAWRVENLLWRTYFGLLFWDELFVDDAASLHSPFEFLPASLAGGNFFERYRDCIEARLSGLDDPAATKHALLKTSTRYYGTANGVFRWRRSVLDALFALVDKAPAESSRQVLRNLCTHYSDARHGWPDLMVLDPEGVRFVEIKAEGDQLRRNQQLRLARLRNAGFRADVVCVRWVLDPGQTYVVVDVETTGGRGEQHRVTEIGAVKVRDDRIVDRFQTLLNPQRAIPPGITRLTGITQAMVSNAPYFADIAADFERFMDGAIFVAHNVDFDYVFISQEFRRIGRPFRHAKLCTCSSMRKLYPGHKSYSLGNLCRAFDITLKQHHRALCDAEAAAELLMLVNEKRRERLAQPAAAG